jgi:hypothetical protein
LKARIAALGLTGALALTGWAVAQDAQADTGCEAGRHCRREEAARHPAGGRPQAGGPAADLLGAEPQDHAADGRHAGQHRAGRVRGHVQRRDLSGWKGLLDPKKKLDNPFNRAKLSPTS